MNTDMQNRITFHDELQIMEADFSDMHITDSEQVNHAYDALEQAIANSGEEKWFFLVNYSGTKIEQAAWFAFSLRGKDLNLAHSQGSVRFDVGEATRKEIARRANTEEFDANLFSNRDDAIKRISELPSQRLARVVHEENLTLKDIERRVSFLPEEAVMDIDFSNITIAHSDDVNLVYDFLENIIAASGRKKWYFLINYDACHIHPEAWIPYSQRGKSLNINHSLGSVRYAPGSETEEEIRTRAESQDFRPNIRNTRAEALDRIEEMR
jgi:hypothetical protein